MVLDELGTLHKHTARATAGVIDTALEGLQYLNDGAHNTAGRIELASILAFHRSELLQAILIDTAQQVFLVARGIHLNVREEVNHITQAALVQLRTCIVARQHTLQLRVLTLDGLQRIVDDASYLRRMCRQADNIPSGFLRYEEHAISLILVFIFHISILIFG